MLTFFACMSQLLLVRGLNLLTCTLIACGIALRTAGWLETRLRRFGRHLPHGIAGSSIIMVGLAVGAIGWETNGRHSGTGRQGGVTGEARNVLLIVMDTVRADHLSLYGYGRDTTPNLRGLADQGVRFERARATAPWTLPSHASLFTGRWPHELGVEKRGWLDAAFPTLAEFLGTRGYATAGFVANQFFCGHETGLSRGYGLYRDYPVTPAEVLRSSTLGWLLMRSVMRVRDELRSALWPGPMAGVSVDFSRKDAATINREFLDWLSSQGKQPFFAFLNYFDAHDPYLVPPGASSPVRAAPRSRGEFAMLRDWYKIDKTSLAPEAIRLARDAYDDCIAALDNELGRLFAALRERGILDQTLVILTADHGEQFGENGKFGHGLSLHDPEVHVPLVIASPASVPRGQVVEGGVSLHDIPATVVDLLGYEHESPFPGQSLARTWQPPQTGIAPAVSLAFSELHTPIAGPTSPSESSRGDGSILALLDDTRAYIRYHGGNEELYKLDADPAETHDLSQCENARPALERYRSILERIMTETRK
jgi:arylsulfatase A-like enzyme